MSNVLEYEAAQQKWYAQYYNRTGSDRNDLRTNRETLFQLLATERSVVEACYRMDLDLSRASILDVGCGAGGNLFQLIRLGARPSNITGIDIQADRLAIARELYPSANLIHGDAMDPGFASGLFDLVYESTLFTTITDVATREGIARNMLRVCRPGGFLLLVDWRFSRPFDKRYRALSRKDLFALFGVGRETTLMTAGRGALIPPVGRFLSKHAPGAYFACAACFPLLVGQVAYLLRKSEDL